MNRDKIYLQENMGIDGETTWADDRITEYDLEYIRADIAQERENKLIDMIIKSKQDFCPESLDLETDYKWKKDNCSGIDAKCNECWKNAILASLKTNK